MSLFRVFACQQLYQKLKFKPIISPMLISARQLRHSPETKNFLEALEKLNKEQILQLANEEVRKKVKHLPLPTRKELTYEELFELCIDLVSTVNDLKWRSQQSSQIVTAYFVSCCLTTMNKQDGDAKVLLALVLRCMANYVRIRPRIIMWNMEKSYLRLGLALKGGNDYTVLTLLGQWHFKMSRIGPIRRAFMRYMYNAVPPQTSYMNAYAYFLLAEKARSEPYIPNIYNLGRTCFYMGVVDMASLYFDKLERMKPNNEDEVELKAKAWRMNIISKVIMQIENLFKTMFGY